MPGTSSLALPSFRTPFLRLEYDREGKPILEQITPAWERALSNLFQTVREIREMRQKTIISSFDELGFVNLAADAQGAWPVANLAIFVPMTIQEQSTWKRFLISGPAGVVNDTVINAALQSAGSGYAAGNILTFSGGLFCTASTVRVNSVDGGGGIIDFDTLTPGNYIIRPTNPVSVTGGTGTGATFNLTWNTPTPSPAVDVGIYKLDGTRIVSKGSAALLCNATYLILDTTDTVLDPGRYYMAMAVNVTGPQWLRNTGGGHKNNSFGIKEMASAFPLPATATLVDNNSREYIPAFRLSSEA